VGAFESSADGPLQSSRTGSGGGRRVAAAFPGPSCRSRALQSLSMGAVSCHGFHDPPSALAVSGRTLGVFPRPPAGQLVAKPPRPSRGLRSAPGTCPRRTAVLPRRAPLRLSPSGPLRLVTTTLMGFRAPTAHQVAGSDLHRVCLTRLCGAYGLSQTLDASFRPQPCRPCSMPTALMGFPLQRVPLPVHRLSSRRRCPSRRHLRRGRPQGFGWHRESVRPARGG
jgi:hypothetical protein